MHARRWGGRDTFDALEDREVVAVPGEQCGHVGEGDGHVARHHVIGLQLCQGLAGRHYHRRCLHTRAQRHVCADAPGYGSCHGKGAKCC